MLSKKVWPLSIEYCLLSMCNYVNDLIVISGNAADWEYHQHIK